VRAKKIIFLTTDENPLINYNKNPLPKQEEGKE
jgi:hypothetical protein